MPDTPYRVSKPAAAGARHAAEHVAESARQATRSVAKIKEGPLADAADKPVERFDDRNPQGTKSSMDTDGPGVTRMPDGIKLGSFGKADLGKPKMDTSNALKSLQPPLEREQ